MKLTLLSEVKCFGGDQLRYHHSSETLNCEMTFSLFLPSIAKEYSVPVLFWLSGLTCTDENFVQKAGAQQYAEKYGIAIIAPDTSPRGEDVPDDINSSYDFGLGAGFYVNATQPPFNSHYKMYDYIVTELPKIINENFSNITSKKAISGHSMGGHGALTIGLKNAPIFTSISAFSPISSPMNCPWGIKALSGYLGENQEEWKNYDACELIKKIPDEVKSLPVLIDQGTQDNFLIEQLKPELLEEAAKERGFNIKLRMQEGYDHSYFFIASFIEEHIAFHAKHLLADL